jgi:hypothetical protein
MEATKELVGELLLDPKGVPARKYDFEDLMLVLEKCKYMSLPSIHNDKPHSGIYKDLGSWTASPS